jgi:hypothetical protein
VTLPHDRYGEYLEFVYTKMAAHVPPDSTVLEIGARHDRGVISKRVIPHKAFLSADRNTRRGDMTVDVLYEEVQADVILSTCVLHHTPEHQIQMLLDNLCAPILMFSGPNVEAMPELFGDHQWHIEIPKLAGWLEDRGYRVSWERVGLTEPLCEVLVVGKK